jgi:nucleoside-diphosphate-sugar epimerase
VLTFDAPLALRLSESDCRIIVTGAGGWLGLATLEMLEQALGDSFNRRVVAIASGSRRITLRSGRGCNFINFQQAQNLKACPTIIAHYAFLTRDKVAENSIDAYVEENRKITQSLVFLAQQCGATGLFSASSGAVYQHDRTLVSDINLNPYGVLKVEEETALQKLALRQKLSLALCRLFNLSGPFIHKSFALNSILLDILSGQDVVLKAAYPVVRDYIYVKDLVSLGFSMMCDDANEVIEAFDTGIGAPIEITDLAKRAITILAEGKLSVLRPQLSNEADTYIGDVAMISALAEKYALSFATLEQQILETANYLRTL